MRRPYQTTASAEVCELPNGGELYREHGQACRRGQVVKERTGETTPEWFVNSKKNGHLVAAHLGARVPETYYVDIASASIELKDDIVIKPTFGADSVGVFLVKDRSAIFDATAKEVFAGETELRKRIAAQLASGKVKRELVAD